MNHISTSFKFQTIFLVIVTLLLFSSPTLFARNYYFSTSTGVDTRTSAQAQNPATPWKSISKLNSFFASLAAGDQVLFKRGETFYGTITVNKSGTSSLPIVIGAYGTGNKPTISGFTTLISWTNEGGGIYSKTVACETKPNLITINGKQYGMGRYPNVGTNLIYESFSTNVSITDNELPASPNWTGAEAVIRKNELIMDRCLITNHTNHKLTYTSLGYPTNATAGYYYFIQNDLRTLNQFGEWYYNGTKLYVFFGTSNPNTYLVKIPTISQLIYGHSKAYITITDLAFEGTCTGKNKEGGSIEPAVIFFDGASSYTKIKNCSIDFCGANGITLQSSYSTIDNNSINHFARIGIEPLSAFTTVTNNVVKNSGIIQGSSYAGTRTAGIWGWGSDCLYQYNTIDSVAKGGILFWGNRSIVKNNLITHFNIVMNDGGGIYTDGSGSHVTEVGKVIDANIVLYGVGNKGKPTYSCVSNGIYLDSYTNNVTVKNNTVAFVSHSGLYFSNSASNTIYNNTSYANTRGIYFIEWSATNTVHNNVIKNNIFFAKNATDRTLEFQCNGTNTIGTFGISDSNYFARPIADSALINTYEAPLNNNRWQNRTRANWQTYTGQDAHSKKSPISISNTDDIRFEYNATKVNKTVSLPYTYIDVKGKVYANSITLLPFTSAVLIKSASIPNQPPVILNQTFQVNENSAVGTNVGTVVASDPNAGQTLTYSILSGNTNGAFSINSSSGQLTVASSAALSGASNYSLFPATPSIQINQLGDGTKPIEVGMKFKSNVNGFVSGFRYYKGSGAQGIHTGSLWSVSGVKLASATFINETASGWQTVTLSTPVAITANTIYVVSYFSPHGDFVTSNNYFTSDEINGPITALASTVDQPNGVFSYNSSSIFPNKSYASSNYWADVIFKSTSNYSLFPAAPSIPINQLGDGTKPIEVGMKFKSNVNGSVSGFRYYKGSGAQGIHTGSLWSVSGVKLASATFINETASGWQTVTLSTPVAITANTIYVVSYYSPHGDFVTSNNYFTSDITNGPLTALASTVNQPNGVFSYNSSSVFPNKSYASSNYWADVIFTSTLPPASFALNVKVQDNGAPILSSQPTITINLITIKSVSVLSIISIPQDTVSVGSLYSYKVLGFSEDESAINYIVESLPLWLSFMDNGNGTATFEGTPNIEDVGTFQIILEGKDNLQSVQQVFSLEVKKNSSVNIPNLPAIRMHIYPNPVTNGILNVKLDEAINEQFILSILDMSGKLLLKKQYEQTDYLSLDLSALPPEVYLIQIRSRNFQLSDKFIIY